jgi:hypothetical protein
MFDVSLTDSQHEIVGVTPVDINGNPAPLTGLPSFVAATPGIVVITPSADGTSVDVAAVGPGTTGSTTVIVSGVTVTGRAFSDSFNVNVSAVPVSTNEAVGFAFVFGIPVPIGNTAPVPVQQSRRR